MNPENKIREVVDLCADCDICRYLMETTCLLFPELYRLFDRETETGVKITAGELRRLVDLCNFCAVCPCPNIRADIMQAKTAFIDRDGLKPAIRILENVDRIGKLCGAYPQLVNALFPNKRVGNLLKTAAGIHNKRDIPLLPKENFVKWAKRHGLQKKRENGRKRKAAYFSGCSGRHFFPDVARAAVEVLRYNGIDVYYPEQQCIMNRLSS